MAAVSKKVLPVLGAALLGFAPASRSLDVHLQALPPAPGLAPSAAMDSLEGVRNALSCGLDFLDTARQCGLSAPLDAAAPFAVSFDPQFCRLTMRFNVGQLIDGLLGDWINGAFAKLGSPFIGALCLLGVSPGQCKASGASLMMSPAVAPGSPLWKSAPPAGAASAEKAVRQALKAAQESQEPQKSPDARVPEPAPIPQPKANSDGATGLDALTR